MVFSAAHFSGYRADQVRSINWDIVLLLSPYGLIQNWLLGANAYLHAAYGTVPPPFAWSWTWDTWNWHYLYLYFQSNLLEVLFLVWIWPRWRPVGATALRISALNFVTHPIVFFVLMKLPFGYLPNVLIAEAFAIGAEGLVYSRLGFSRPWLASLFANLVSWQLAPFGTAYLFLWDKL